MKSSIPISVLLSALCALPVAALANPHDGGSNSRPEAPRQQQQYHPRQAQYRPQQTQYRPQQNEYHPQPVQPRNVQPMPRYQGRTTVNVSYVSHRDTRAAWDWNRGNIWYARPNYWGGGFWGAFSLGLAFNSGNNSGYYAVQQSSPGAQLLAQYGLTQTTCDQPNLVDINGPDGGEICAYPNDMVSPGQYSVDPSTLSLISN